MTLPRPAVTFALVLACGVIGVLFAVWFGTASDGGRGGAVGVALSLAILFSGPPPDTSLNPGENTPATRLRDPLKQKPGELEARVDQLEEDVVTLRNTGAAGRDWDKSEKLWLAAASAAGTLFWGFGDLAAHVLGAASACCG